MGVYFGGHKDSSDETYRVAVEKFRDQVESIKYFMDGSEKQKNEELIAWSKEKKSGVSESDLRAILNGGFPPPPGQKKQKEKKKVVSFW